MPQQFRSQGRPKDPNRDAKQRSFYIDRDILKRLDQIAPQYNVSGSVFVEKALNKFFTYLIEHEEITTLRTSIDVQQTVHTRSDYGPRIG